MLELQIFPDGEFVGLHAVIRAYQTRERIRVQSLLIEAVLLEIRKVADRQVDFSTFQLQSHLSRRQGDRPHHRVGHELAQSLDQGGKQYDLAHVREHQGDCPTAPARIELRLGDYVRADSRKYRAR